MGGHQPKKLLLNKGSEVKVTQSCLTLCDPHGPTCRGTNATTPSNLSSVLPAKQLPTQGSHSPTPGPPDVGLGCSILTLKHVTHL